MNAELRRNDVVKTPATRLERRFFEDLADEAGTSLSEWVREAIYNEANRQIGKKRAEQRLREYLDEEYSEDEIKRVKRRLMRG